MTYISCAAFYEGNTDEAYFELLISRVMEDIIMNFGARNATIPPSPAIKFNSRSVDDVAQEICRSKEAFHLIFIHADTGGRSLSGSVNRRSNQYCTKIHALCSWPPARCVPIRPRHEVEAWVLCDPQAVTEALGFAGKPATLGLPLSAASAEGLTDPKATLTGAANHVRGRRRAIEPSQLFAAIAQRQSLAKLRDAASFKEFEINLKTALSDLGCI